MGGGGSTYDYGFRIYNPQIGKFLSVDPLTSSYPWYTPYQFAGNKPIAAIDLDGLEEAIVIRYYDANQNGKYTGTTVIRVMNPRDRPLGATGVLYINQPSGNIIVENNLRSASRASDSRMSVTSFVNNANNGVVTSTVDNSGNITYTLVPGTSFYRQRVSSTTLMSNSSENQAYIGIGIEIQNMRNLPDARRRNREATASLPTEKYKFQFSYGSSSFEPSRMTDNPNIIGTAELTNLGAFNDLANTLINSPDMVIDLRGYTSSEDETGLNAGISQRRADVISNMLLDAGVPATQIINNGGQGASNLISNDADQNDPSQDSVNRRTEGERSYPIQNN